MAKYKENVKLKKRKPVYVVDITKHIVESSSTPQTEEQKKIRIEHKAQMTRRRANSVQKKINVISENKSEEKLYDLYSVYHQLNYNSIQEIIKNCGIKPAIINNSYLIVKKLTKQKLDEIKQLLLQCHFETKTKKEYKVRIMWYLSKECVEKVIVESRPSNNNSSVAAKAKSIRKSNKKIAFNNRIHTTGRKTNKICHLPATKDTSNLLRKILINAKKACRYLEKKEKEAKKQAFYQQRKSDKTKKTVVQRTFNFK